MRTPRLARISAILGNGTSSTPITSSFERRNFKKALVGSSVSLFYQMIKSGGRAAHLPSLQNKAVKIEMDNVIIPNIMAFKYRLEGLKCAWSNDLESRGCGASFMLFGNYLQD